MEEFNNIGTLPEAVLRLYNSMYVFNLHTREYRELKGVPYFRQETADVMDAEKLMTAFIRMCLVPEDYLRAYKFLEIDTMPDRLRGQQFLTQDFCSRKSGWIRVYLIPYQADETGRLSDVMMCTQNVFIAATDDPDICTQAPLQSFEERSTLANITKTLYGFNLMLDVERGTYRVIVGTGMGRSVQALLQNKDYVKAQAACQVYMTEEYIQKMNALVGLEKLRSADRLGFIGQIDYPMYYPDADGPEWHEMNVFLEKDSNGKLKANMLVQDITETQRLREEQAQLAIAKAASEAKTSFLFNMSHDIRTPMNAIMGFTNLLEKYQEVPERRQDYLNKIRHSSNILLSIINNVLEMSRIEKGTLVLNETAWHTAAFNDTLFAVFHDMMHQKKITFRRKIHVQHQYVFCDPIKLREVFINILSNAYKYTNPGGRVLMEVTELPSADPEYALFRTVISDNGIGMSEEFLPRLFEEFSREHTSTENKVEGTGLGMPIVKRLLTLMHGSVEVDSKQGVGTTFTVTIPHRIAEKTDGCVVTAFSGAAFFKRFGLMRMCSSGKTNCRKPPSSASP